MIEMKTVWVLKCRLGCEQPFTVKTRLTVGQYKCPVCGHRPRADLRGGGSVAVLAGPFKHRSEGDYHALKMKNEAEGE
jgi:hypothetical protein